MTNDDQPTHVPRWLLPSAQSGALRLAVVVVFVAAVALSAARIQRTLHVPPAVPEFNQGLTDFHTTVYFPALALQNGFNPYSREYIEHFPASQLPPYSPALFWLSYPFSLLTLEQANVAYFVLCCAMIVGLAASSLAFCRVPLTIVNVLGLATLISALSTGSHQRPARTNHAGSRAGALWAMELSRRRPLLAGLALALTTLKPTFAVPMIWLLWCRRDYRTAIAGVLIGGAAAVGGLVPLIANHGFESVVQSLVDTQAHLESDKMVSTETTWTRIDAVSFFGKLVGSEPNHITQIAVLGACLLAAGFALWTISRTQLADGADSLSGLIICTATLACVYHGSYDALLLVAPWVAVMAGRLREQLPAKLRVPVWLLLTIPAINYVSTRVVISKLSITEPLLTPLTMLNSTCILAAFVLSIGVAVYAKSQPALAASHATAPS